MEVGIKFKFLKFILMKKVILNFTIFLFVSLFIMSCSDENHDIIQNSVESSLFNEEFAGFNGFYSCLKRKFNSFT